jgi:hypothetical protein
MRPCRGATSAPSCKQTLDAVPSARRASHPSSTGRMLAELGANNICCIKSSMRSLAGSLVLLAAAASALVAQPAPGAADADFFETKIRPLFADKCYACHTGARMGGLQLDSREHFLKGGKSGPIAVPGDPGASLLVKALRYDANPKMPPTGKLAPTRSLLLKPGSKPALGGRKMRKTS